MKRTQIVILLVLFLAATACTAGPAPAPPPEPAAQQEPLPVQPPDPVEEAPIVDPVPEAPAPEAPEGYLSLGEILQNTDISYVCKGDTVLLTEDGLEISLSQDSQWVYRRGFITGNMRHPLQIEGEQVYVPEAFYEKYLLNGWETPSLYHGALFFKEEIQAALEAPDSTQGKKLLDAMDLPRSMGVETRHLDMLRLFSEANIADNQMFMEELRDLGYEHPEALTYGEFQVIDRSRILTETLFPQFPEYQKFLDAHPGVDPETCIVEDFVAWQDACYRETAEAEATPEEKEFLEKYDILAEDVLYLRKMFQSTYMETPEDQLRQAIETFYQMDIDYVCQ